VLACAGDGGYPYAVPLNYAWVPRTEDDLGRIVFHCAREGHKLDAIARCDKVSFCVVDADEVVAERFLDRYRSVVAFGRARVIANPAERRAALEFLGERLSPGQGMALAREVESSLGHVAVVEVVVEHLTGKEALELTREREAGERG
jgi:nitroimidazol reductase NimA-like FMN-containing flavoprotein (pyridoxamine 5'-phosphate oxidase superfamily)